MEEHKLNKVNSLLYLPLINRFVDSEWHIMHDFHNLFDTWQLDSYKKTKKDIVVPAKDGVMWTLYYLDRFEASEVYELIKWNEYHGINMIKGGT